ncbi:MAG: hypothetical protein ACOC9P_01180 [bacterium]
MLLALGLSVLLAGLWGGLLRLGAPLPVWLPQAVPHHGALMIGGFLGTLITLERAVALGRWWCFAGPLLAAAGAWAMLAGWPASIAGFLITAASAVLVADFVVILHRQRTTFTIVMALGAAAWAVGNALWLAGWAVPHLVPWWAGFLILTIVGERLEMSRFMPSRPGRPTTFVIATGLYVLGLVASPAWPGLGLFVMGLGLIALAAWLIVFDVARRTIHQPGVPRFAATALLGGYGWLAIGGALACCHAVLTPGAAGQRWIHTVPMAGLTYDAVWHSLLLGFVFAMIFGHAPIIFPAVLGIRMRFTQWFYSHLLLLHLTLIVRIAGDLILEPTWRAWGGMGNAAAILMFLAVTVINVRRPPIPRAEPVRHPQAAASGTVSLYRPR